MKDFFGKAYRYKDKIIGVCNSFRWSGVFMVGLATTDEIKRFKAFAFYGSIDEAQAALDQFARGKGLPEVQE